MSWWILPSSRPGRLPYCTCTLTVDSASRLSFPRVPRFEFTILLVIFSSQFCRDGNDWIRQTVAT